MPQVLTVHFNNQKIDELVLTHDMLSIGRKADNDLRLEDTTVSSHHARLISRDGNLYIEDCNSTNGTLLNSHPVTSEVFHPGDVAILGKYTLTVHEIDSDPDSLEFDPTLQIGQDEYENILARIENVNGHQSESLFSQDKRTLNWIAQDESGAWWGFENQPALGMHGWVDEQDGTKILLKQDREPNLAWRDSIQRLK